jgi:hypothetical protein
MRSLPPTVASITLRPSASYVRRARRYAFFPLDQVWKLPAEAFAKVTRVEMVGVIPFGNDRGIGFALV